MFFKEYIKKQKTEDSLLTKTINLVKPKFVDLLNGKEKGFKDFSSNYY